MKAIVHRSYGPPSNLKLEDLPTPMPSGDEVLVRVKAAAVNPLDWHTYRADPFFVRFSTGLFRPKKPQLGADMAGIVEAVGDQVTAFNVGDEVFGDTFSAGVGSFAEYACVAEKHLVKKPSNLSFEEAASVPVAALTALHGLRDYANLQSGQHVLINGASGGVGCFAIQLAKVFGAHVTAVCSTKNGELVRSIGADEVVDYTKENYTEGSTKYDVIADMVVNHRVRDNRRVLAPSGVIAGIGFFNIARMFDTMLVGAWHSMRTKQKIGAVMSKFKNEDLVYLADLLQEKQIKPVIDRTYPLEETAQAMEYLETGRVRGKVVIRID